MLVRPGVLMSSSVGTGEGGSPAPLSPAALLAQQWAPGSADALVLNFIDDYHAASGHFGSAYVKHAATTANDYDSHPYGLLSYTSPSAKMVRGPDGEYRFGAHNLYVNSAASSNQSITVLSGADYAVTVTGTVSVTASGAASGTWTAGTHNFTAATGTLTLGSTSGAGTVHVRRTPSDPTYLSTSGSPRYALPFEWDADGNLLGILCEPARTNVFLNSATGSTQDCTVTAAAWTLSFWGTGSITLSGAHSATLDGTGDDDRVSLTFTPSAGTLGLAVSGTCSRVQLELGEYATSYIPTYGATVTRAVDNISLAASKFAAGTPITMLAAYRTGASSINNGYAAALHNGTATEFIGVRTASSNAGVVVLDGNVPQAQMSVKSISPFEIVRHGISAAPNSVNVCANGSLGTRDTSATMPTVTVLEVGIVPLIGSSQSRHMQTLIVLPIDSDDAGLQAWGTAP